MAQRECENNFNAATKAVGYSMFIMFKLTYTTLFFLMDPPGQTVNAAN